MSRWNGENQPLEVWVRDKQEWQGWQEYRPARNDFNRPFIFSLMQFYHESDIWMFGGVYRVSRRRPDAYEVELTDEGAGLIGRLKLRSPYRERATRVKFETTIPVWKFRKCFGSPIRADHFLDSKTSICASRSSKRWCAIAGLIGKRRW
jgi:hypothetical protein